MGTMLSFYSLLSLFLLCVIVLSTTCYSVIKPWYRLSTNHDIYRRIERADQAKMQIHQLYVVAFTTSQINQSFMVTRICFQVKCSLNNAIE